MFTIADCDAPQHEFPALFRDRDQAEIGRAAAHVADQDQVADFDVPAPVFALTLDPRVEGGLRRHDRHAVDRVEALDGQPRSLAQGIAKGLLMGSVAVERRRDRVLHGRGAAETSIRELPDRAEDLVEPVRPADREPPGPPARRQVGLRQ